MKRGIELEDGRIQKFDSMIKDFCGGEDCDSEVGVSGFWEFY